MGHRVYRQHVGSEVSEVSARVDVSTNTTWCVVSDVSARVEMSTNTTDTTW